MGSTDQSLEFLLEDLARRRTFVKPEHTIRGFFFKGILAKFRTLGDEALVRRCLEVCGQEQFVDFFSYSTDLMCLMMITALPTLAERHGGAEAALRQLGAQSSTDFLASVAGKTMMLLAQGRPRPLLTSLSAAMRVAMSYGSSQVEWLGPRQGRFTTQGGFMPPPFHEGLVWKLLEVAGAREIQATAHSTGELDMVCEFSWE